MKAKILSMKPFGVNEEGTKVMVEINCDDYRQWKKLEETHKYIEIKPIEF